MECYTCSSLSGKRPLFPESKMYEGKYWILEHMYPSKIIGWLVLILKRHTGALHNLTKEEFSELGSLLGKITTTLSKELKCEKEYILCSAEKEHFNHVHFHIVAKPENLPDKYIGTKIFSQMKHKKDSISKSEIIKFCKRMKKKIA